MQMYMTHLSSWWFQPIWKILVKLDHFPKVGMKIINVQNHRLVLPSTKILQVCQRLLHENSIDFVSFEKFAMTPWESWSKPVWILDFSICLENKMHLENTLNP